jgi:DNA-directed RNA polymerase subunit F
MKAKIMNNHTSRTVRQENERLQALLRRALPYLHDWQTFGDGETLDRLVEEIENYFRPNAEKHPKDCS